MSDSPVLKKIKTRGYWRVVVRPEEYVERRIQSTPKLLPFLMECAVQLRGWDFPHISLNEQPAHRSDSIIGHTDWHHYVEYWRFFLSGQFAMYAGFSVDWRDQARETWVFLSARPLEDRFLSIGESIARMTEILEFAGRLGKKLNSDRMVIDVSCMGLSNRTLAVFPWDNRMLVREYQATENEFKETLTFATSDLLSSAREMALPILARLFNLFGWDPANEVLRDWQKQAVR